MLALSENPSTLQSDRLNRGSLELYKTLANSKTSDGFDVEQPSEFASPSRKCPCH